MKHIKTLAIMLGITLLIPSTTWAENPKCLQIKEVRRLAKSHNLSTKNLDALQTLYCTGKTRPNNEKTKKQQHACNMLRVMTLLAVADNTNPKQLQTIRTEKNMTCNGTVKNTLKRKWPTNQRITTGTYWYYPNSKRATSGNYWYYPNGQRATSGTYWYYPNGKQMRSSSYWYAPTGDRVKGEQGLLAWFCHKTSPAECRRLTQRLQGAKGLERNAIFVSAYSYRHRKATKNPNPRVHRKSNQIVGYPLDTNNNPECISLTRMLMMARAAGMKEEHRKILATERTLSCTNAQPRTKTTWYWPNRKLARNGKYQWYYPNGKLAQNGKTQWYYPNGRLAQNGKTTWYYPNGKLAQNGNSSFYTPKGTFARNQRDVLSWACGRMSMQQCKAFSYNLNHLTGAVRQTYLYSRAASQKK